MATTRWTPVTTPAPAPDPGPPPRAARLRRARTDVWIPAALAVGTLVLYVRTLLPGIGYHGDTAKWQFLGAVGGTPHPTGYPLYLAINRAFVNVVPVGSLAWRVNLLSAVLGAATVASLFLLLRALGVRRAVATATAAAYAVTATFWSQAVVAEVYTLHLLLLTTITWCLVRWRAGGPDLWLLAGIALVCLSFGNHMTTMLAVPGVAWMILSDPRGRRRRTVAWVLGCAALGAAQYGYLVWMTEIGDYVEVTVRGVGDLPDILTGSYFREQMLAFSLGEMVTERVPMAWRYLWGELGPLVAVAVVGIVRAWRGRHRAVAVHLLVLGSGAAVYAASFDVPDAFVFFLPAWLALTVFVGVGAEGVADRLDRVGAGRLRALGAVALVIAPLALGATNVEDADRSDAVADAERIERVIEVAGRDAVIATDSYADSQFLWYYLLGERLGEERGLTVANQTSIFEMRLLLQRNPLTSLAGPTRSFNTTTRLFTTSSSQADDAIDAGMTVTEVADEVWRIAP